MEIDRLKKQGYYISDQCNLSLVSALHITVISYPNILSIWSAASCSCDGII